MGVIGQRIRRVEDPALVTGAARFTNDVAADALELWMVRSTVAHARIRSIDTTAARSMPGVVGVFTAEDLADLRGVSAIPLPEQLLRPPLAPGVVRFVGEIVAVVAARTQAEAEDASEAVFVEYEPLPVAASLTAALDPGAPLLFPHLDSNRVLMVEGAPSADFVAGADLVVDVEFVNQRVAVAPLESNAVLAEPDGDGLLVHLSTQAPHAIRDGIAAGCGLDPALVRVIAPSVGGGFGAKSTPDVEYLLTCHLARRLQQPVRWRQIRTDNLLNMHGRGQRQHVKVAARADGTLLRIHADIVSDNGAYPGINHFLASLTARMLAGTYRFEQATADIVSVATNTASPTGYRGAGRPEAASLVERVVDIVAAELALDPVDLRRRNLIPPDVFPYTTPTGAIYDSGDYAIALDRALALARYDERRAEQATRRANGDRKLLGIGVSCYVEVTAGAGPTEYSEVEVHADATATVRVGTFGHGQGHRTTYAQIAADALGLPFEAIEVLDGDTGLVARGVGTYGSRSIQVGGTAVHVACGMVVDRAKALAADLLEAAVDDIVHDAGGFAVAGVPSREIGWVEVAAAAAARAAAGEREGLFAEIDWERPASTFPFGAHVSIVEVDRETGAVELLEHVAVDDCGTVMNPLLRDGQVHGGIAQGAAQALLEQIVYDADGNLLTSNLADYAFVSTAELPSYTVDYTVTPTAINPLGAKGIGEAGTIGSTPAVHNAVIDAVAHLGVRHIDMPCTAERVWRAISGLGDDGHLTVTRS
ncbi:MAG TPA: xanthine dehydrogenase family protein molybdopterin-binding subunit [Acidimicrobiales bacterium]|jgi:carbon-monoxide dehydrogenase large subunit|nr:xanthine dehydrogenase family protein molybdopterin-binding subunit [Acidimicrobiales bacterium]